MSKGLCGRGLGWHLVCLVVVSAVHVVYYNLRRRPPPDQWRDCLLINVVVVVCFYVRIALASSMFIVEALAFFP